MEISVHSSCSPSFLPLLNLRAMMLIKSPDHKSCPGPQELSLVSLSKPTFSNDIFFSEVVLAGVNEVKLEMVKLVSREARGQVGNEVKLSFV
ncbi:hypothetical protein Tco_0998132 [Tanacetum coccineum]